MRFDYLATYYVGLNNVYMWELICIDNDNNFLLVESTSKINIWDIFYDIDFNIELKVLTNC